MTHVLIGVPARAEDKALWEAVPGCECVYDEAFAAQNLAWADVIFGPVPGKKLALCTRLKWLQYPFAGVERYCLRSDITFPAGVTLTNATGAFGPRIAEYALAAVLGLYNNFPQYRDMQRAGGTQALGMPLSLHGDTVLVIGAGDIGTAFARLTRPFGCRNIAVRRTRAPLGEPFDETYTLRELPALLPQADTVLCALPATRHTQHVMGAEQFALMKKASVFVNVGRGSAVDTDALVAALQAGRQNCQPKTDVFLRQRAFGGTLFYCVVSLYCIAFSAKVLFTITSCGAVFSSSPAAVITVCSKSKLSCVSTGSVLYAPMSL